MISICIASHYPEFEDRLLSGISMLSDISEIIICYQNIKIKNNIEVFNGIDIKRVSIDIPESLHSYYHPIALNYAVSIASHEYVLMQDSDIIYSSDASSAYMYALQNGADIVGVTHYINKQCYGTFPCVISMMIKKSNLPSSDFLNGYLFARPTILFNPEQDEEPEGMEPLNGVWLAESPILKFAHLFPYPNQYFDVGCNLWLWALWNDLKWVSYDYVDRHNYSFDRYYSNFDFVNINSGPLLFHEGHMAHPAK